MGEQHIPGMITYCVKKPVLVSHVSAGRNVCKKVGKFVLKVKSNANLTSYPV